VSHHRSVIQADAAPAPVGPYSHAVASAGLLFCSGQVPLDPATGTLVEGDVTVQTRRCLDSLAAICEAAGASLADAVRTTVYVTDMATFATVNEAYGAYFGDDPPARVTVGVAALPAGAAVEVDAIVALPG
jgi:2-iminobutanoate/2-iminopropanoate deaminase